MQEGTSAADAHTPAAAGKEATDEEKCKHSEEKAQLNADRERARLEREKVPCFALVPLTFKR